MENKTIIITEGKNEIKIDATKYALSLNSNERFNNFYELGIKLEKKGFAKKMPFMTTFKYFSWSLIHRIMKALYGDQFKRIIKKQPMYIKNEQEEYKIEKPYFSYGKLNDIVECGFKLENKEFTTILPILDSKNNPVQITTSFVLNSTVQRCFVKAVAMELGLGLHMWNGIDDMEQPKVEFEKKEIKKVKLSFNNNIKKDFTPQTTTPTTMNKPNATTSIVD